MIRLLAALAALAAALAVPGCGGGRDDAAGEATLWPTRDRGETVLFDGRVDAGQTVMQALRSRAEVETRYGGRFVAAIDGIRGSADAGRDWFYFVNGFEADRGAAEYRLRPGDVAWWDYRSWTQQLRHPVVVGAFPEPFLHGWKGKVRRTFVYHEDESVAEAARALGRVVRAERVVSRHDAVPPDANVFAIRSADGEPERFVALFRTPERRPGDAVIFELVTPLDRDAAIAQVTRLARDPSIVRFRYRGLP